MAKIKENKMGGVHAMGMDAYKPESSIRLEGAHAKALAKMPMKSSGTITIKGQKTAHRINSDGSHTVEFSPSSVSALSGPKATASDNDGDENI